MRQDTLDQADVSLGHCDRAGCKICVGHQLYSPGNRDCVSFTSNQNRGGQVSAGSGQF